MARPTPLPLNGNGGSQPLARYQQLRNLNRI
jgi:hypothetical protein